MTESITNELGSHRGRDYFLHIRATPGFNDPADFAVVIYYKDASSEETIEVAKVDQAHGYTHFDRLYRRGEPKDRVDWGIWEAAEQLRENWRTYAENFDQK